MPARGVAGRAGAYRSLSSPKPRLYLFPYSTKNGVPRVCSQSLACRRGKDVATVFVVRQGLSTTHDALMQSQDIYIF